MKYFAAILLAAGASMTFAPAPADASEACNRASRIATYAGAPVPISVAPKHYTEVVFPEPLRGILPERPDGLHYYDNAFSDRLFFSVDDAKYNGLVMLHGQSGNSYHLTLTASAGCADSTVTIASAAQVDAVPPSYQHRGMKLIEYMMLGQTPPSYARKSYTGARKDRLVLEQGSVRFYLAETYKGLNYTGFVLEAVNEGRAAYRVALQSMDIDRPEVRDVFGHLVEASMLPADQRLAPAPEYAADAAHPNHQGLVFLVSENRRGR